MSEPLYLAPAAGEHAATLCEAAAELAGHAAELAADPCGGDNVWLSDCEERRGWQRLLGVQATSLRRLIEQHAENLSALRRGSAPWTGPTATPTQRR
jgi:hypothetical protein